MSYIVTIPWYATAFRADDLEYALDKISQIALKRGALRYDVYRSQDDRYKFTQILEFPNKLEWERFWYGDDFQDMRASTAGWYTVPVVYSPTERTASGRLELEAAEH
jgi:hypothetical protein